MDEAPQPETGSNWLKEVSGNPRYRNLAGKFHAHLTFELQPEQIEDCEAWCKKNKVKLTVIDLENSSGQQQTDVMLTVHFLDPDPLAVNRISSRLEELRILAESENFRVTRIKLEHESLPSLDSFDKEHYHEVHIKLEIPESLFDVEYAKLLDLGKDHGFVPSRNPFQRKGDTVTQFANLRIYDGSHSTADSQIDKIVCALEQSGFCIKEVKRETVVYDTGHSLDAWWA